MSEKPAEDKLVQDIDRAIEELEAAARSLDAPEVRRTLKALSDAAKAVATIQDAVKAVALGDVEQAAIFRDRLSAPAVQDALKAVAVQDTLKAVAVQDALKAVAVQDALKAVAVQDAVKAVVPTSGDVLRELVADEVKRALALSGQAAQQAGNPRKGGK